MLLISQICHLTKMHTISIKGTHYPYDKARDVRNIHVQALLAACHQRDDERPLCMCTGSGIPVQVKRKNGKFRLARMPEKGLEHATHCGFHGETEHSNSKSKVINIELSFDLTINESHKLIGNTTLPGLLNYVWTLAKLNHWSSKFNLRSWKFVASQIYKNAKSIKFNGVPITQLLWVMPHMDEKLADNVREQCLNFVRSCNANGHYALIVAPIGSSVYEKGSMCLRFRGIEKPPAFIGYNKFAINTAHLKEHGEFPYPVAMLLAKAPADKPYLHVKDISMLWMGPSYTPCSTKDRAIKLLEAMKSTEYLQVPLNTVTGEIHAEIARIRKGANLVSLKSTEPIRQLPWTPNEKK